MQGFEPRFADFPDYILKITRDIWEGRAIGPGLDAWYHPDVIVRMPGGLSQGRAGVVASTMATLHQFPDRVLLGEDVIWSGDPGAGMLSSHRIVSTATHLGGGAFGPPTGKALRYRIIADCWAKGNMIADEWLIRDNGAIVRQLGHDPSDWARDRIAEAPPQGAPRPFTPAQDVAGPYRGTGDAGETGARHADLLTRIMAADFAAIPAEYDRACNLFLPGGVEEVGHGAADRFWIGLRSSFPSARFEIEHVIGRDADPMMPPRSALRWSLTGRHDGWGAFGAPSGAEVHVMGLAHAEFGPWGLRRDYVLFDEVAVWTQIHLHRGV